DVNGPGHLPTGFTLLRQGCPQMWPSLMPGEHTSSTTHGAKESTSGERRQLLHGIVDHTSPSCGTQPAVHDLYLSDIYRPFPDTARARTRIVIWQQSQEHSGF